MGSLELLPPRPPDDWAGAVGASSNEGNGSLLPELPRTRTRVRRSNTFHFNNPRVEQQSPVHRSLSDTRGGKAHGSSNCWPPLYPGPSNTRCGGSVVDSRLIQSGGSRMWGSSDAGNGCHRSLVTADRAAVILRPVIAPQVAESEGQKQVRWQGC